MALNTRPRKRWLLRLHLLIRFLGLTGLLAASIGLLAAWLTNLSQPVQGWEFIRRLWDQFVWKTLRGETLTEAPDLVTQVAVWMVLGGGLAALAALLVEGIVIARMVAARRSAFGFNALVQIALAAALLIGVNVYSHFHYYRLDWTQDRQFTLDERTQAELRQLRGKGETVVVVYQMHKTFDRISDKADAIDFAAERKVVEKVYDLVDQLSEFGPQFKVVVLDVEEEGFHDKLNELTKDAQELRSAIDQAVENSIFFYDRSSGKVQTLSFNDFYLVDKSASAERNNLVLLKQGNRAFINKVLNIEEKRPRVGVLVIHEWLTTEGPEEFGLSGLKKALTARGFDVRDVVLKKWSEFAPPEPAVYTYDESKYERLEEELAELDAEIKTLERELQVFTDLVKEWQTKTPQELQTTNLARQLNLRRVDEDIRKAVLKQLLEPRVLIARLSLDQARQAREAVALEKSKLNVEGAAERRRMTDLRAKLNRELAEFDLIIIPRMTLRNVTIGDRIPNRFYRLDDAQVAAIRDYLKSGKPLLACFGPINEPPDRFEPPGPSGPDGVEDLLVQLGLRLPRQTVLFNVESKAFAERRSGLLISGINVEVPPVEFDWQSGPGSYRLREGTTDLKPNPIRESMRIIARSVGKEMDRRGHSEEESDDSDRPAGSRKLDLRLRHPRPVYVDPAKEKGLPFDPIFMMTSPASWNDDNPFPTRERTPRFEPKPDDPARGTPEEKRRGPFPVGVAFETTVPADWYDDKSATPAKVRVATIGHGGWFVGPELSPGKEKLLLSICNWLLRRSDLLPTDEQRWEYPRVALSPRDRQLWHWGTQLALPGLFAYLGCVVLLVRRMH